MPCSPSLSSYPENNTVILTAQSGSHAICAGDRVSLTHDHSHTICTNTMVLMIILVVEYTNATAKASIPYTRNTCGMRQRHTATYILLSGTFSNIPYMHKYMRLRVGTKTSLYKFVQDSECNEFLCDLSLNEIFVADKRHDKR